jgi:aminodeoxyfutalosine synthase
VHETIYHEAGAETPQELSVEAIKRLIREAGREPVERDTLYHEVTRESGRWVAGKRMIVDGMRLPTSASAASPALK